MAILKNTPVRLSKAAREFNVGTGTIVDFLKKKGITVESSPNTKLDPEVYELIVAEFAQERKVKEEAEKIGLSYKEAEVLSIDTTPARKKPDEDEGEDLIITELGISHKKEETTAPPKPEEKKAAAEKPKAPAEEKKAATATVEDKKPEVSQAPAEKEKEKEQEKEKEKEKEKETAPKEEKESPTVKVVPDKKEGKEEKEEKEEKAKPELRAQEDKKEESEEKAKKPEAESKAKAETKAEPKPEPKAEPEPEPKPEPLEKTDTPPEETPPAETEEAAKEERGPRVVGKIDLESLPRERSGKRGKKETAKEKMERLKAEKAAAAALAKAEKDAADAKAKAEAEAAEEKKKADAALEAAEEKAAEKPAGDINFLKTEVQKLSGPTIVGKINLEEIQKKERKPVASSSDDKVKAKKKRKRIRKPAETAQENKAAADRKPGRDRKPAKREEKPVLTDEEIQKQIKETLANLTSKTSGKGKALRAKKKRRAREEAAEAEAMEQNASSLLRLTEFVSVSELASLMDVTPTEVIGKCMSMGVLVSINQRLDAETITVVADEFGY